MHTFEFEFLISAFKASQFINKSLPEVAFAGRSNVGKSSLINTMIGSKKVAKVSSTPGRTQSINFYLVNKKSVFVDLPGYGYAKAPIALKKTWEDLISSYLFNRKELKGIVLIVDVRREPMSNDLQLYNQIISHNIPVLLVATKIDKLSEKQKEDSLKKISESYGIDISWIIQFSSLTKEGRNILWDEILALLNSAKK